MPFPGSNSTSQEIRRATRMPAQRPFPRGILLALVAFLAASLPSLNCQAAQATRLLPSFFEGLAPFQVFIEVVPPDDADIHSLQESIPDGFAVSGINYGGAFEPAQRVIRWGPFPDALPRTLSYHLTAPLDAPGSASFAGTAVFQATSSPIAGPSVIPKRPGTTTRSFPPSYLPGQPVTVTLAVRPGASALAWALQETLPSGWLPSPVPPEASFDPVTHTLKWGPFLDPAPRDLSYVAVPPPDTREPGAFTGSAIFESLFVPVSGAAVLHVQPSRITRTLPPPFTPGQTAIVEIAVNPAPYVALHAIEEDIPQELIVGTIGQGGSWDTVHRRIKWGPFADASPRTLTYSVTLPSAPANTYTFNGRAQFDAASLITTGAVTWLPAEAPPVSTLNAEIPAFFDPLLPLTLSLESVPAPGTQVHAVELALPEGWAFQSATHGATFDALQRRIKWGPFQDATSRALRADVQPPRDAAGATDFNPVGWFDASKVPASGNASSQPLPSTAARSLPARLSPGVPFTVRLEIQPASTVSLTFIEESVPLDATLAGITEAGTHDPIQGKIKWGPFPGSVRRTLSYQITTPTSNRQHATFSGIAVFDHASVPIAGASEIAIDHPPFAQPDLLQRPPEPSAKVSVLELLANDADVDADPLKVRSVTSPSAAGGRVRLIGPWVFYDAPASGVPSEDQFSYTLEDAYGSTSVASVTVLFSTVPISSRLAIIAVVPQGGGKALVRFRAVPGTPCRIEVSRDLRNWSFIAEATTGPLGTGEIIDPDANASPVRFYRASVR